MQRSGNKIISPEKIIYLFVFVPIKGKKDIIKNLIKKLEDNALDMC